MSNRQPTRGASAFMVVEPRLRLSRAPAAELAAAAMLAREDAGLDQRTADFVVVAVRAGHGEQLRRRVEDAALGAVAELEGR